MARKDLPPEAQRILDETEERLKAEYEAKKSQLEAAAARRPWTVIAWSAAAGAVLAILVLKVLF